MAKVVFAVSLLFAPFVFAETVSQALISSNQTYVVNDKGESVQELGVGQMIYVVLIDDSKKDKKRKDFYRVTFDPTNLSGDGWVLRDKVKLVTGYRSVDGKEPTEYEKPAEPTVGAKPGKVKEDISDFGNSDASSFLEELIKKDEQKSAAVSGAPVGENPAVPDVAVQEPAKTENNPLQSDLEFLFLQQEGEFKETFQETRTALKESMQKKFGISDFVSGSDPFAGSVNEKLTEKLKSKTNAGSLPRIDFVATLDKAADLQNVSIPQELHGVFFGQMSPKIGDSRLLKIKYYDRNLKQFTFEKVAKIPLQKPDAIIEKLADDCYQFISK